MYIYNASDNLYDLGRLPQAAKRRMFHIEALHCVSPYDLRYDLCIELQPEFPDEMGILC